MKEELKEAIRGLWRDAKTDPPKSSGPYVICYYSEECKCFFQQSPVYYSKKWKVWNAFDSSKTLEEAKIHQMKVDFWMEPLPMPLGRPSTVPLFR